MVPASRGGFLCSVCRHSPNAGRDYLTANQHAGRRAQGKIRIPGEKAAWGPYERRNPRKNKAVCGPFGPKIPEQKKTKSLAKTALRSPFENSNLGFIVAKISGKSGGNFFEYKLKIQETS